MKNKKGRFHLSLEKRKGLNGLWFVAPFIIGLILLYFSSIIQSFIFSVNQIELGNTGYALNFVGLDNYKHVLTVDPLFFRTEVETVIGLVQVIVIVIYSLFIATLLNQKMKGRGIVRAIFFLPVILSTGIIHQIEVQNLMSQTVASAMDEYVKNIGGMYKYDAGIVDLLFSLRISPEYIDFIISAAENIYGIVKSSGVQIVILLAGLQSISPSIYEAAYVEGCSGWESFWKITLPLISPLIPVCVVWTISEYFLNVENPIMKLIVEASQTGNYSVSSAMAFVNFGIMAIIVTAALAILNIFVFNENKR